MLNDFFYSFQSPVPDRSESYEIPENVFCMPVANTNFFAQMRSELYKFTVLV